MILAESISAAVSIRDRKLAVCAGRKVANALTVLKSLKNNALQRFTSILVDFSDRNVLFHDVGDHEKCGILAIVFNGKRRFIEYILRIGDSFLSLICTRLRIREPNATVRAGGVVAEQFAVLINGKSNALNRLMGFAVDFQNTKVFFDGVLESKRGNFSLILNQLDRLLTSVHIVMLGIAAGFLDTVSTRLEVFNHRFAVLVGSYSGEVCIIVVNVKLPARERNLGFLVDLDDANGQLFRIGDVDLVDELSGVGGRVNVNLVYLLVAEITLRRLGFNYLIKSLGQIVQARVAVDISLYGCKYLTIAPDFKGRALQRHLGVLVVLVNLDARARCVLKGQLDVLGVIPCKGLNVRAIGCVSLRRGDLVDLERAGR